MQLQIRANFGVKELRKIKQLQFYFDCANNSEK